MIDARYKINELSPCPFCGTIPEMHLLDYDLLNLPIYWVECPNCSAQMKGKMTEQSAIDAWNARTQLGEKK